MMNNHISRHVRLVLCLFVLSMVVSCLLGCNAGAPGLTAREVHRRHVDTMKTGILQMQDDIDAVLMIDRPSRLSEKATR